MANINQWETIEGRFTDNADFRNINHIRDDLQSLNQELQTKANKKDLKTKADEAPIYKRVEEMDEASLVVKKSVAKLRGEHDGLVQRVNEAGKLMEQLPRSLQDSVGSALQSLCQTQFAAIGKLCEEKLALLAALEKQAGTHAGTAAARQQETVAAARSGVEDIRRELEELRTYADRTQAEFTRRLQEAEETARRAQEALHLCRDDAAAKVATVQQARDEATQAATATRSLLAGCDTLWGRLRWMLCGSSSIKP